MPFPIYDPLTSLFIGALCAFGLHIIDIFILLCFTSYLYYYYNHFPCMMYFCSLQKPFELFTDIVGFSFLNMSIYISIFPATLHSYMCVYLYYTALPFVLAIILFWGIYFLYTYLANKNKIKK